MRDPGEPRRNPLFAVDDGPGSPPPSTGGGPVGAVLAAMQEAGPEATEHLLNAAHELVLAIKVVVDATERALEQQRSAATPGVGTRRSAAREPAAPRERPARVTRINLA